MGNMARGAVFGGGICIGSYGTCFAFESEPPGAAILEFNP